MSAILSFFSLLAFFGSSLSKTMRNMARCQVCSTSVSARSISPYQTLRSIFLNFSMVLRNCSSCERRFESGLAMAKFCQLQRVVEKHRDGHGPYAARDGSDVGCFLSYVLEVHVADRLTVYVADSDVNDDSAFLDQGSRERVRLADRGDEDICRSRYF